MTDEVVHIERGIHICPVCGEAYEYAGVCAVDHPPEMTEEFTETLLDGEIVCADSVSFIIDAEGGVTVGFRSDGKPVVIPQ